MQYYMVNANYMLDNSFNKCIHNFVIIKRAYYKNDSKYKIND